MEFIILKLLICSLRTTLIENLSQGARIAFARQFRGLTQDEVSDKLGLTGESKRRTMARYERGDRNPKEDRLLEIANILNVNVNCIKEYNFNNNEDIRSVRKLKKTR